MWTPPSRADGRANPIADLGGIGTHYQHRFPHDSFNVDDVSVSRLEFLSRPIIGKFAHGMHIGAARTSQRIRQPGRENRVTRWSIP